MNRLINIIAHDFGSHFRLDVLTADGKSQSLQFDFRTPDGIARAIAEAASTFFMAPDLIMAEQIHTVQQLELQAAHLDAMASIGEHKA